jgi:F420H(2)-dependent quinone reductase
MTQQQQAVPGRFMRGMQWFMPIFTPVHTWLYRKLNGGLGTDKMTLGAPVLVLTTKGRRSGEARSVPIGHVRVNGEIVVAGTNGGLEPTPAWVLNLLAEPRCTIQVRDETFEVVAEFLEGEEWENHWSQLANAYPTYNKARSWVTRHIPLIRLRPLETTDAQR